MQYDVKMQKQSECTNNTVGAHQLLSILISPSRCINGLGCILTR